MFGYLQLINPTTDIYIKDYGNFSGIVAHQAYDPVRRDHMLLRSMKLHFGPNSKLLWLGDFHAITLSHANMIFGASSVGFKGVNVSTLPPDTLTTGIRPRPVVTMDFAQLKGFYSDLAQKEDYIMYFHDMVKFVSQTGGAPVSLRDVFLWISESVTGPVVIRTDCVTGCNNLWPSGSGHFYFPYERKTKFRYGTFVECGKNLTWSEGPQWDVKSYVVGFNFVTRANSLLGGGFDEVCYRLMMQAEVPRQVAEQGLTLEQAVRKLASEHHMSRPQLTSRRVPGITDQTKYEAYVVCGPFRTGQVVADSLQMAEDLAWREMLGTLKTLIHDEARQTKGCC
ncbi:VP9 [Colorado tick fever virus]|nr:VP9 [Colorado tick fever virus]O93214.1 RecName: Full=Structural protein VP9 [Colorado tick fever virus Florio N-7180]AAB88254.1 VP 9 [Colorado tick fever virus]UVC65869.1 VP9 [Colorado tick fever virus]